MEDYYILLSLCCIGLALVLVAFSYRRTLLSRAQWMTSFQSMTKKYDTYVIVSAIEFLSVIGMLLMMLDTPSFPENYASHPGFLLLASGTIMA